MNNSKIEFTEALPKNSKAIFYITKKSGVKAANVVEFQGGEIGVSDSNLMAVLTLLNIESICDRPRFVDRRCWWVFLPSHKSDISDAAASYYCGYSGDRMSLSFIRRCFELRKGYKSAAIDAASRLHGSAPLSLRRL